jgi:Malectin domain
MVRNIVLFFLLTISAFAQVVRIDSGSSKATANYVADRFYTGGGTFTWTPLAPLPPPTTVIQDLSVRHGSGFYYDIPVGNGKFNVVLNFVEVFNYQPGQRKFNVEINGQRVLENFDIVSESGGWAKPISRSFVVTVGNLDGIRISFTGVVRSALVSNISIYDRGMEEDAWCPGPSISRESDKILVVGANWSEENPCYVHFPLVPPSSVDPLHISKFTKPIRITLSQETVVTDDIHIWAKAPEFSTTTPTTISKNAEIQVGIQDPTTISFCDGCTIVTQTLTQGIRLFPPKVVPIGFGMVFSGKLHVKVHDIISTHAMFFGDVSTFIRKNEEGFVIEIGGAAQTLARLEKAREEVSLAQIEASKRFMKTYPLPEDMVNGFRVQLNELEGKYNDMNQRIPVRGSDMVALRAELEQVKDELRREQERTRYGNEMMLESIHNEAMMKVEQYVSQFKQELILANSKKELDKAQLGGVN